MSSEPIRELMKVYEDVTKEYNDAIDKTSQANNELALAKAHLAKCKNMKDLIEEQIRVEKKLMFEQYKNGG